MKNLRIESVAVAVILNDTRDKFLLVNNHRWKEYALPMKKVGDKTPAQAALDAITDREFPGNVQRATTSPACCFGEWHYSPTAHEQTAYEYHVFEIALRDPIGETTHPDLRWFTYEELQSAINVTESTKSVLRHVVEHRHIAVAIVTRERDGVTELMLLDNPNYGLFPPATRIKDSSDASYWALQALRTDIGYDGSAEALKTVTVEPKKKTESGRYGVGAWRQYELVWLDINSDAIKGAGHWHPIDSLKTVADASPQLDEVRLHLL